MGVDPAERARFEAELREGLDHVVALCAELVPVPSENPPGDTGALVGLIEKKLAQRQEIALRRAVAKAPAVNLIAS